MIPYANYGGNSGVRAYSLEADAICVEFSDGASYRYDVHCPGRHHVDMMISLARGGSGLNSYINRYVRESYAARLR